MDKPRIAWLLTSAKYYWHPTLSHFAKLFPQMIVFAPNWCGYAAGFEDSFTVEAVSKPKIISLTKSSVGYGSNFTFLPLNIFSRLLQFQPHIIFSNSFGMWTILVLLLKPLRKWRVVIAYEGSSPSVDARNSTVRLCLRRAMIKATDACITNSHAAKDYLIEFLDAQESHVFVQPYEVPAANSLLAQTATAGLEFKLQRPAFLFVGKIIPRKGLHILLKACAILQRQRCCEYTLLVVGEGPQRHELETFTKNHELSDRVKWIGQVDYSELGNYFRQTDVFVLPSFEDTWGMVVLEAMVMGKPILCSKWAGAAELVVEGENGYCFDPHVPEELAKLMHCFISEPQLAVAMGYKSAQLMTQYTPEAAAGFLGEVTSFVSAS